MHILRQLPEFSNKTGSKLKGNQRLIVLWNLCLVSLINLFNNVTDTFWFEVIKEKMPSLDCSDLWECIIEVTNTSFYGDSILINLPVAFDE